MLQEFFLSLSGHPSPLFSPDNKHDSAVISPSEKALLASVAHLSNLHCKLLRGTKELASNHPSSICQAVATSINAGNLVHFQRKVLAVESSVLQKDAGTVGAYNIVPLTAVTREFDGWTRRMEWLWELVKFMGRRAHGDDNTKLVCTGAQIIDKLCRELKTGYEDIEETALQLVRVAETAWLKQVSAWLLYGRLPSFGKDDFFIAVTDEGQQDYFLQSSLLPEFATGPIAESILFIGKSLNHIRQKGPSAPRSSASSDLTMLQSHLQLLSSLTFPLSSPALFGVISAIRKSLSQNALQKLLPLSKICEMLLLLRGFFLLDRGEFAMALIVEADEKVRTRWRRADNIGHEKRQGVKDIVVKEGEVSAVLARTWAVMSNLQGETDEEDDTLELARDLIQLQIIKNPSAGTPLKPSQKVDPVSASLPFKSLLFSVPVTLSMNIPSPMDLFLTSKDLQTYSAIHAYLLAIRRAHLRLTGLWKVASLRRHHPPPPAAPQGSTRYGKAVTQTLRLRAKKRSATMRIVWATSSAAIFFLGETEAYFQDQVIQGTWEGFQRWLQGDVPSDSKTTTGNSIRQSNEDTDDDDEEEDDIWLSASKADQPDALSGDHGPPSSSQAVPHDSQALATAHRRYLNAISTHLLLRVPAFTTALFELLKQIDHMVSLVNRLNSIWQSLDLEADEGVVDAFSDFGREEREVLSVLLEEVVGRVKEAIRALIEKLRGLDGEREGMGLGAFGGTVTGDNFVDEVVDGEAAFMGEDGSYVPVVTGRIDRLLMKLDFGGWFDADAGRAEADFDEDDEI